MTEAAGNPAPAEGVAAVGGLVALYQAHRAAILRFLVARTRDEAEAEDLIQELWLRLQQARLQGPVGNGRAYLFQMANHLALDRARERRRRSARDLAWFTQSTGAASPAGELADPGPGPDETALAAEERTRLVAAIEGLPEAARHAFCLHKLEGLGHAEVAQQLGISRSGVEKHIALAMKHLRRALLD